MSTRPCLRRIVLLAGLALLTVVIGAIGVNANAEVHVIKPSIITRTCNEGHKGENQAGGYWSDHERTTGNLTWLKFGIPSYPGERIAKATIDIGPLSQFNHPWDAGVQVHYVQDDSWTAASIRPDWATTSTARMNRNADDQGKTSSQQISTDVTNWLALPGEGQGRALSVRLGHTGGGQRGWWIEQPTTLTITTERLPRFDPPRRAVSGPGGLAVRSSLVTVFAEEAPKPDADPVISLTTARRESESAQLVIIAGKEPVSVAAVDVTVLQGSGHNAKIAAASVTTNLVGYVTVKENSWRGSKRTGLWPDVLMPIRPFAVPAEYCRTVWVTVTVPEDAAPGNYSGHLRVRYADGGTASVPLQLRVWDFALPESPALRTSYWMAMGHAYDKGLADPALARKLHDLFGAYRTSTDTWAGIRYYREPDGGISVDFDGTKRNIAYAIEQAGFNTVNVSSGCWGSSPFGSKTPVYDRRTGEALSKEERDNAVKDADLLKLYLNAICDWLQQKGWLDRAYMQLWDEPARETWSWGCRGAYPAVRRREPRLALLCVAGVHPELQGLFDIWVPHLLFHDPEIYQQARQGVRLSGEKNFAAKVTASSTGGWGTAAFYQYRPIDAYDGCTYSKWVPGEEPQVDSPQWLRFDFNEVQRLDGIRVSPHGHVVEQVGASVEVSADGKDFSPVQLRGRKGEEGVWSFEAGEFRALRIVYRKLPVAPTDEESATPSQQWPAGISEVEFLRQGLPAESTLHRPKDARPCDIWEYNVGADWPSVCIDAKPHEHRATGWLMWLHDSTGYLNYGGGQWKGAIVDMNAALADPPPLIWLARGNGSPNITWPGAHGPLASIRFARFRDGIDDYDYLTLLAERVPDHSLLGDLRKQGRAVAMTGASIQAARQRLAEALEGIKR